ncbi:MAG: thioredoxin family protein [Spirosomataceae bacterium]
MSKTLYIFLIGVFVLQPCFVEAQTTLRWTSFENLNDSLRKERRPLMVFIHTDWCKYCKMMEVKTFADTVIAKKLNQKFYCLDLNAEDKQTLLFLNKKYKFKPSGVATGVHELAELLGSEKGKLTYPTTVFFDQNLQLNARVVGVIDSQKLQSIVSK